MTASHRPIRGPSLRPISDVEHFQNFGQPPTTSITTPHTSFHYRLFFDSPEDTNRTTQLKWCNSQKSLTKSSSANKKAHTTKTTGTQTPVRQHHNDPTSPIVHINPLQVPDINPIFTESDTSSIGSAAPNDETLYERILALQDIIPASTRRSISSKVNTTTSWLKSGFFMGGKTLWVVSTSALLLGVPWALAYSEEQMIVEQERAELMAQRAQSEVS
jgi:hypothetical protein